MSTYVIGDIHGCFDELQRLLDKINFSASDDTLVFVGDLINRGMHSLKTLEFIYALPHKIVILGNHDLYLINLAYEALPLNYKPHTLMEILDSPRRAVLADWLRRQPLMYKNDQQKYAVVHAGIPAQWTINQAHQYAAEVSEQLCSTDFLPFLKAMFGDEPHCWHDELTGFNRLRYITNALTRMRLCTESGCLDTHTISDTGHDNSHPAYRPWFEWHGDLDGYKIYFGHWAALHGKSSHSQCIGLDTGCVWGSQLTAVCLETQECFQVNSQYTAPPKH
jgi:bis(5'-nucleosyl)-tetraphosphatase (symmetrical)